MAELGSVLDALAAEDLFALPAPALLDREAALLRARNRLDAELARTTRRAELAQASEHDGLKTMASWLRGHGHLSPRAAGLLVRGGRALTHLPTVAAGCADGLITADQLAIIAPITTPANLAAADQLGVDLAEIDRLLAEVATGQRHDRLAQLVAHYLSRLDPDGPEPDPTENRALHVTRHDDGSRSGRFDLDAVGGEKLDTALEAILQAGRCAGDIRTRPQQLADALVQLADLALAGGGLPTLRTAKPHVLLTLPAEHLTDSGAGGLALTDIGRTGFGALLSTAEIRHLACDSVLTRILLDPDGVPIHHGRSQRVASPQPPTPCSTPSRPRDPGNPNVHHVVHWLDGGETCPENSGPALRTPPHEGPPRLPDRTRPPRPLAHLPPRRHRDRRPPAPAELSRRTGISAGRGPVGPPGRSGPRSPWRVLRRRSGVPSPSARRSAHPPRPLAPPTAGRAGRRTGRPA